MSATGLCWLTYEEQMLLRRLLQVKEINRLIQFMTRPNTDACDAIAGQIAELTSDNKLLRAEIEALQRMRHEDLKERK